MSENLARALELFASVVFFGGLGAAAGWWIQGQVRKRRLRKLGFKPEDLKSKEAFFTRLGQITMAQIPQKITFNEVASHSWSNPSQYAKSRTAFESLGFQRTGVFIASPQTWVAEFWINSEQALFGTILDSSPCGIYSEVFVEHNDGSTVCF